MLKALQHFLNKKHRKSLMLLHSGSEPCWHCKIDMWGMGNENELLLSWAEGSSSEVPKVSMHTHSACREETAPAVNASNGNGSSAEIACSWTELQCSAYEQPSFQWQLSKNTYSSPAYWGELVADPLWTWIQISFLEQHWITDSARLGIQNLGKKQEGEQRIDEV